MKTSELRTLNPEELQSELLSLTREQFSLRMQAATSQLSKPHLMRINRRAIARVKTIMREKANEQ